MSYSIRELRELTDKQLIEKHDERATHTVVGTQYYIDELDRRSRERNENSMHDLSLQSQKLAKRTYIQSWISVVASIVALVVSVTAIT